MDGYAVFAPVERVHAARVTPAPHPAASDATSTPGRDGTPTDHVARIDLSGRSVGERLAERLEAVRATLSQTTFFLFDADSWR